MLEMVAIGYDLDASPRIIFGVGLLKKTLEACGYHVGIKPGGWDWNRYRDSDGFKIYVGNRNQSKLILELEANDVLLYHSQVPVVEGFYLSYCPGRLFVVAGGDDSGALYGCQELLRRVRREGTLPRDLSYGDAPSLAWRGPVIGLQKQEIELGRQPFEYPWTPDRFPWLYDKVMWIDYLDMMLEQRGNTLYLWNANPFSSLIDLPEEKEALEVTRTQQERNASLLAWLVEEADKRGIRVFLSFYSIHIPHGFADKYGLPYRHNQPSAITSRYFRQLLSAFVAKFPTVGLMVCLGEQLKGQMYGAEWLCETILPAVQEGIARSSSQVLPPVIVRSHGVEIEQVMAAAEPLYANLHSEMKFNGESLTTWAPRGAAQQLHERLGARGNRHVATVHMLTNLEPFRWGAPAFIQRCVQSIRYRLHASALQFYPLSYWSWPYTADKSDIRIKQVERDWVWFEAWLRYAWNPDREEQAEQEYWISRFEQKYGSREAGAYILQAYEASGRCAPMLLRRFGITQGNRQTMSLGMTMSQLTNPNRYVPWSELWESHAPQGERLEQYVLKDLTGLPHVGETPLDIVRDAEYFSEEAYKAIQQARGCVQKNKAEFERLASDIDAIRVLTGVYTCKVRAALVVYMYKHMVGSKYTMRLELLDEAAEWVANSLAEYRKLTEITEQQYWYAGGMQTRMRKVPFRDGRAYSHWKDCLPMYEQELSIFRSRIAELRAGRLPAFLSKDVAATGLSQYKQAEFTLHSKHAELFQIVKGARVFTDGDIPIINCAPEVSGLTGIRFSQLQAAHDELTLDVELKSAAWILIGLFNSAHEQWLQPMNLGAERDKLFENRPVLHKGVRVFAYPSIHVHALPYEAGRHTLQFGKGAFVVIGVIQANQVLSAREFKPRDNENMLMDWLFEETVEAVTGVH